MTAPARRPRRRPGGGGSETLARITAARERLDAEIVARRRRELELLTEYAAVTDAVTDVEARRDEALADLERQAAQLREAADQELASLELRQAGVLVALHGDRTAEELAHLVGLPLSRVRRLIRTQREPSATTNGAPPARPAAEPSAPPQTAADQRDAVASADSGPGHDGSRRDLPSHPDLTVAPPVGAAPPTTDHPPSTPQQHGERDAAGS